MPTEAELLAAARAAYWPARDAKGGHSYAFHKAVSAMEALAGGDLSVLSDVEDAVLLAVDDWAGEERWHREGYLP